MNYKLIAVISQDGYIARYSGDLPTNWTSKEEQNYFLNDMKKCEWSVMGMNTHELSYSKNKKRIIFTKSIKNYKFLNKNQLLFNPSKNSFHTILDLIKPVSTICILGGTKVYDYFIENNLLSELIITVEPIFFNEGLPLFSSINCENFIEDFENKGFILNKEIKKINNSGTKYYHFYKN